MRPLSHDDAKAFIACMTYEHIDRVFNRLLEYSAGFPDIRDAITQAVSDELAAREANRQPDDPGIEFQEPDVGRYPGWVTAIIWLVPIAGSWLAAALLARWLLQ
jgi:hypothetical protein